MSAPSLPKPRPAPPLTPRRFVALVAGKSAAAASRLTGRGGGQSLPGLVARRFDPTILEALVGRRGLPVVVITGSNGKTTTARFAAAILRGAGLTAHHNRAGANLVQGVTSLAVGAADLRGRIPDGVVVAEVDEGALAAVAPEVGPRVLLVTDLFRDQLDRFGELYAIADAFEAAAGGLPEGATLVVNADDPLVGRLSVEDGRQRLTFGCELNHDTDRITRAADSIRCPDCRADLVYDRIYLSHMGAYHCPACGFARPPLDVAVTDLEVRGLDETWLRLRTPAGPLELTIPQSGVHIAYDAAAAVGIAVGLGVGLEDAAAALREVGPAFGRLERIQAGERQIILAFAKNPTSFNTTLRALATEGEPRQLLIAYSNTLVDGEDFAWLWDVELEGAVGSIERATVSGLRSDEVANRLKYAGLDPARIFVVPDRAEALD
ncbi:MAG TPA: MurT ligase domain-containing protein, partial [Candidatus Limnocylindrales bacterium]|nr:MurT ligase domain-containing protein [Candidatus Limnocylindrales bacterium]